jgi:hypothetical protein
MDRAPLGAKEEISGLISRPLGLLGRGNTSGNAEIAPKGPRSFARSPAATAACRPVYDGERWLFATDEFWQHFESEETSCQLSKSL